MGRHAHRGEGQARRQAELARSKAQRDVKQLTRHMDYKTINDSTVKPPLKVSSVDRIRWQRGLRLSRGQRPLRRRQLRPVT